MTDGIATAEPVAHGSLPSRVSALLRPTSVALVGASDRSRWSSQTFANLRRFAPGIRVHCVNTHGGIVHGIPAAISVTALGEQVDLVYVMTPRETVPGILEEAGALGARAAVVLTAGFGESEDGMAHQRAAVEAARRWGITLLGPNGNGFVNLQDDVVAFGLDLPVVPALGPASFVLQSGGLVKPLLGLAHAWGVGVGAVVCTGNEADLTAAEVALAMLEDPRTGAVGMFLEAVRDVAAFRALAARAVELDKPIVVLTVGRSEVAKRAAKAHTGALAGDAAVASAALSALGVVEVGSMEELVATTYLLSHRIRPGGRRVAVVGASGGACELIVDRAEAVGLTVPPFGETCREALGEVLPDISQAQNPLDVTGVATTDPRLPMRALDAVQKYGADEFDVVLFQAFVLPATDHAADGSIRGHFADIGTSLRDSAIPALLQDEVVAPLSDLGRDILRAEGLVRLPAIEVGLAALVRTAWWTERQRDLLGASAPAVRRVDLTGVTPGGPMNETAAMSLLAQAGVPVVPHVLVTSAEEAGSAVTALGQPAVLKVCSPDIEHKSDVGGVVLSITDAAAARAAYRAIMAEVGRTAPAARVDGALVAPMRSAGTELIVGIHRDPTWGPALVVGLGGVLVEALRDVAIRPLPVTGHDVLEMLDELRGAAVLRGTRGRPPADRAAIADAVLGVAALAEALGEHYDSIEVNPLRVDDHGAEVLDALIVWSGADEHEGAPA